MTLHLIKYLSASSLADYLECPLKWAGRRVFGWVESGQRNELAMALGTAVHYALSAHHRGEDAELTLLEALDGIGPNKGHGIRSQVPMAQLTVMLQVIGKYTAAHDFTLADRPAKWFEIDIPSVPLKFVGEFDLLRPDQIDEFKTTSSGTWWNQARVDTQDQATAYWYAFAQIEGYAPERMVYHVLPIGGPKVGQVHALETRRTPLDLVAFEALVQAMYHGMTTAPLAASCLRSSAQSLGSLPDYGRCEFQQHCPRLAAHGLEQLSERYIAWQAAQATGDSKRGASLAGEIEGFVRAEPVVEAMR